MEINVEEFTVKYEDGVRMRVYDSDDYEQWEEYGSTNNMLRYKDSTGYDVWYNSDGDTIIEQEFDKINA